MDLKKKNLILMIILLAATLAITGCITQKNKELPKYPDSERIEIPSQVAERLKTELLANSTVEAYSTNASVEEVNNWYDDSMTNQGWNKVNSQFNATIYKKSDSFVVISIMNQQKALETFEVNKTVIVVVNAT